MAGQVDGSIIVDTNVDPRGFERGSAELRQATERLSRNVERVGKKLQSAVSGYGKALASGNLKDIRNVSEGLRQAKEAAARFQTELQKFKGQTFRTDEYKEIQSHIDEAQKALGKLLDRQKRMDGMGVERSSKAYQNLAYDIRQAELRLKEVQFSMRDYLNDAEHGGEAPFSGADTAQFDAYSDKLRELEEATNSLSSRFALLKSAAIRAAGEIAKIAGAAVLAGMRAMGEAAAEAARSLASMTSRAVTGGIRRLGAWLSNAAKSMLIFQRASKKSDGVLKRSFMTILRYGLGIRSLYFLFNKIRAAIKEGFQNLARYSDDVNKSVSQVISSFTRFKNQFAASFAPIVNVAAPAMAKFIDLLSEATYRTGQFFAALSGQKTVIRAKEVQEDYRKSLDKTAKSAKDAKNQLADFDKLNILKKPDEDESLKPEDMFETVEIEDEAKNFADAFKEAWVNVDLTGIGESVGAKIKVALDKIPWPDIKQAASDLGKRLATFLNGLINVPELGKSLGKSLAEAINTAFSFLDGFAWTFDWKGFGNFIMDTIEGFVDNLDWSLINHALQGLAHGFAKTLNTIFSRVEVWKKIGETIANGINAAVNFAITFLEDFDFVQAAVAIVAALNKAVEKIEWDKIGRLLADALGGALRFLRTALLEFHWTDLGTSFAKGVNEFVAVLLEKIRGFEWEKIGKSIADGVNAAVSGIGWNSFGTLVGRLIGGALKIAASFIRGLDYEEIKKSIEEFFSSALRRIDWYDFLTVWAVAALMVAVKKIIATHPVLAFLTGAILALGPKLGGVIHKMVEDIPWEEVGQNVSQFLVNALNRLHEAIQSVNWFELGQAVGRFLGQINWSEIVNAVFKIIGDLIIAGVKTLGGIIVGMGPEGILNALWALVKIIAAYIAGKTLLTSLSAGVTSLLSGLLFATLSGISKLGAVILKSASALPALIGKGLISALKFLAEGMELAFADISTLLSSGITNFEILGHTLLSGAAATIATAALGVIDALLIAYDVKKLGEIQEAYVGELEAHNRETETALNNFEKLYREKGPEVAAQWAKACYDIDVAGQGLEDAQRALVDKIDSFWADTPDNFARYLYEGFTNGLNDYFGEGGKGLWQYCKDIFGGFIDFVRGIFKEGSPSKVMEEIGGNVNAGFLNGISGTWPSITDFFGNALNALKATLDGEWMEISGTASNAWNGISTALSDVWNHINANASTSLSELGKTASGKWQGLKTDATKAWNDLKTAVGQTISSVKQEAISKVSETANSIRPQWARIKTDAVSEWNGLKSSVVSSALSLKAQVASAFQSLQGTLSGVWSGIRSAASGALASVSGTVNSMVTSISSRVSSIRATVSNITSSASDALSRVANKMDDLTRRAFNGVSLSGFASGGVIRDGGRMSWWDSVRKYASGTARASGSLFVAGEAGPELVGHVNGRTEVLNESQIAGAIYSAVLTAMREAVSTLGGFISQQMASNTNALITAIGQLQAPEPIAVSQTDAAMMERLAALSAAPYEPPAYATGTVMPYEVAAEIRRQTSEITSAIYDNGKIVISAVASAISNHGLALADAIKNIPTGQGYSPDYMAQYTIDEINRRTRMMGKSPLLS